jgi:hypothetical protein
MSEALREVLRGIEREWLDHTPPAGHPLIHGIFQRLPQQLAALAAPPRDELREALRQVTARLAIVNHYSGECDDCNGDEGAKWCDGCWRDAEEFVSPDSKFAVADEARAALEAAGDAE